MSEVTKSTEAQKTVGKSEMVKVRVKHGRLLIDRTWPGGKRELGEPTDLYANDGDVVEVPRHWAEKFLGRQLEGYPSGQNNTTGKLPGVIRDCPIELVA